MWLPDPVVGGITEAVIGYLFQEGVGNWIRDVLGLDPVKRAYQRSLRATLDIFAQQNKQWIAEGFDESFFKGEAVPILAQFLIRDGRPDPSAMAACWADSFNLRDPERRTRHTRALEPVAADFLDRLAQELRCQPELQSLHDSQAFERLVTDVAALRSKLGAAQATPGTRRDYLHWVIERNLYLDPRGTYQTRRQVQVKLDDVYISLRAQQDEAPGEVDRRLGTKELEEFEADLTEVSLPAEEAEDRREQLLARLDRLRLDSTASKSREVL